MKSIVRFVFLSALVAAAPAYSQGIRTNVVGVITISSSEPDGVTVSMRYNDAVAIAFPVDATFIQGVEFELRIPKAVQGAESSIAWSIYSKVSPFPSPERLDYGAELVATQPLPARVSLNLVLPTLERHSIKNGPFASLIPAIVGQDRFPLMFKLSPIGKGFGPAIEAAEFKLTIRPILRDDGGIKVSIAFPEGSERANPSIFIDDRRVDDPHAVLLAKKGARVVRVSAEGYREEIITIAVEAGRVIPVMVTMTPSAPLLVFQAPAGTFVSIDGVAVHPTEMGGLAVEPGEHTLFFRIGDYSMIRKILALRGKSYQVVLSVELDIVTNP